MGKREKHADEGPFFRPISWLSTIAAALDGQVADIAEEVRLFEEVPGKPYVLDDQTVNRAIRVMQETLEYSPPLCRTALEMVGP